MKHKKLAAIVVTTAMVVTNCMTAFAVEGDVNGSGTVEYDDSDAIAYDSVTLPTTVADSTYAFQIDPYGMLEEFGAQDIVSGDTVLFESVDVPASVEGKTTGTGASAVKTKIYKKSYSTVAATSGEWTGVVTELNTDDEKTIKTVADGFYVWSPLSTAPTGYTGGTSGEYVALTVANIENWFSYDKDTMKIKLLPDYKAGANVCDGNLYQVAYTELTDDKISDSKDDPLSNYVTITSGAISTVSALYKNTAASGDPVYALAEAADLEYTAATPKYSKTSTEAYAINKSTKKKTISVTVTLQNAGDLDINGSDTFTGDAANKASIYIAAKNGSTVVPLTKNATTGAISATFTADLLGATDSGETLYQKTGTNPKTGGHTYGRFSGPNPTTTNHSFTVVAAANSAAGAKDAWTEWAKTITADTRPTLNVVYSINDFVSDVAPSIATTSYTVDGNSDVAIAVNFGAGSLAATGIAEITFLSTTGATRSLDSSLYSVSGTTLTIAKDQVSAWIGAGLASRSYIIKFNDSAETTVEVTMTK